MIGDVEGKNVIIVDDLIDTGGTVVHAAKALKDNGAEAVYVGCTHAVFSGDAVKRLEESPVKEVVVTDTIPFDESRSGGKVKVLSVAGLLAEAIRRIHIGESVSSLFI